MSAVTGEAGGDMTSRTPLARVRGLGPSGEGAEHWWEERLSSIAVLCCWSSAVFWLRLPAFSTIETIDMWLSQPLARCRGCC